MSEVNHESQPRSGRAARHKPTDYRPTEMTSRSAHTRIDCTMSYRSHLPLSNWFLDFSPLSISNEQQVGGVENSVSVHIRIQIAVF